MTAEQHSSWFSVSNKGWVRLNAGRDLWQLVREAVSNVWDTPDATLCSVTLVPGWITIEDDSPTGILDGQMVTSIFMTDKEDSPLKRGRKGRGLKELLAASTHARVEIIGQTIHFNADGTRLDAKNTRTVGTKIELWNDIWTEGKVDECALKLHTFITPEKIKFRVNDENIYARKPKSKLSAYLRTQVIKDGIQIEEWHDTDVVLYDANGDNKGWLYELGVPVQAIDAPWHIDVQQRIPMNDNRDTVSDNYKQSVLGNVLPTVLSELKQDQLTQTWVYAGISGCNDLQVAEYLYKLYGHTRLAVATDNHLANDYCKQHGFELIDPSTIPSALRYKIPYNIVHSTANLTTKLVSEQPLKQLDALRDIYPGMVILYEWLTKQILGEQYMITFVESVPVAGSKLKIADHDRDNASIRFNIASKLPFSEPLNPSLLAVLCHEMSHHYELTHDENFLEAMLKVSGELASTMLNHRDKVMDMSRQSSAKVQHNLVKITCQHEGCKTVRWVKPQDTFQVKFCEPHKKLNAKLRNKAKKEY